MYLSSQSNAACGVSVHSLCFSGTSLIERVYENTPFLPSFIQVHWTPEHAAMQRLLKQKSFMCRLYVIQKHNGGFFFEVRAQLTSKWRGGWQSLFLDSPIQKHLQKYFSYFSGLKVLLELPSFFLYFYTCFLTQPMHLVEETMEETESCLNTRSF